MYQREVSKIRQYVTREGPKGVVDVGTFVLCSIQTPLSRTGQQVADVKLRGAESKALWGHKSDGYRHMVKHSDTLYELLREPKKELKPTVEVLRKIMEVPCLGIPKASFLMQCLGWNLACLDVHNLRRYGLPTTITKATPTSPKVYNYAKYTRRKGAEYWWDSWCAEVAGNRMNKSLQTADEVSAYHYKAITGED